MLRGGGGFLGRDRALQILRSERQLEDRYMLSAILILPEIYGYEHD